jgi:hypothetical protein
VKVREEQAFEFQKSLLHLQAEGFLSDEAAKLVTHLFNDNLDEYRVLIVDTLKEKIASWENGMGEDDKSLYSLGLRRAVDLIEESDPTEGSDGD